MQRVISLFREPGEADWYPPADQAQADPAPPPVEPIEPVYFRELMAYLRQRNAARREPAAAAARIEVPARNGSD